MRDKNKPEMPPIPALTQGQLNCLLTADYLVALAGMIRKGMLKAFSLDWSQDHQKPLGRVQVDASILQSPLELRMLADLAEEQEKAAQQVPVEDLSEHLKDHEPCDHPQCLLCANQDKLS